MSPFHTWTALPISTKFCTNLHTNSGKVLNTIITSPTQPLDPGVSQTPEPKWVTGEKTLCNVKCPDGWRKLIKFLPGSAGPGWLIYIYKCETVWPMSPFHARAARSISTKFCTNLPTSSGKVLNTSITSPIQPLDPGVPQTPKPKWVTGEKTLWNIKFPDGYPCAV